MELACLEESKALAVDAMSCGQLEEADALLETIEPQYLRHGEIDGLFALRFNRLLIALERDDQHTATALMAQLADALDRRNPADPAIADMTARIAALFRRPVSGIDYQLTEALTLLCDQGGSGIQRLRAYKGEALPGLPKPSQLLGLEVLVWVPLLFDLCERTTAVGEKPRWLRALHSEFITKSHELERMSCLVDEYRAARADGDRLKAYRRCVEGFALAGHSAPPLAGRLLLTLEAMEMEGLPKKLAFAPNSPQEARLESTVSLLGRLAEAMNPYRETSPLARRVWQEVLGSIESWYTQVARRDERGARRADDTEKWAGMALWHSRALQNLGELEAGGNVLAPSVALAERRALPGGATLGGRILYDVGLLGERQGRHDEARGRYVDALNLVMPGLLQGQDITSVSRAVDTGVDVAGRCGVAIRALAGLGRLAPRDSEGREHFRLARTVLAFSGSRMGHDEAALGQLWLELSASKRGDDGAEIRALEAAHSVQSLGGTALAMYFNAVAILGGDQKNVQGGLRRAVEAAALAREGPRGSLRTVLELGVARLYDAYGDDTDEARLEIHLRRAAESLEKQIELEGQGEFDVFLAPVEGVLEELVSRLAEKKRFGLVRRLVAAYRGWGRRAEPGDCQLLEPDEANGLFRERLEGWWIQDAPVISAPWPEAPRQVAHQWPRFSIKRDEACLEVTRLGEQIIGCLALLGETFTVTWYLSDEGLQTFRDGLRRGVEAAKKQVLTHLIEPLSQRLKGIKRLFVSVDVQLDDLDLLFAGGEASLNARYEIGFFQSLGHPLWAHPSSHSPHRLKIVGDGATAVDLKLSMLTARSGLTSVEVVHGDHVEDVGWAAALAGGRHLHLVGPFDANGGVGLLESEAPVPPHELAQHCAHAGTVLLCIAEAMTRRAIDQYLPVLTSGVRGGVLIKRWPCDTQRGFLLIFLEEAWHSEGPRELVSAFRRAQSRAQEEGMASSQWDGYQLYLALQPS